METEKVLVTGGAGFIGSHIAEALVRRGFEVKVIDNLSFGKKENLAGISKDVDFKKLDITNFEEIEKEFKGIDYVLHLAALRSVIESTKHPNDYNLANINGTVNVLEAAKRHNVKRVVFTSSSSVYGNTEKLPESESDSPNPLCPYALTKLVGEHYCRMYSQLYGLETVSLRYFNVFGPRQEPKSSYAGVIPLFTFALMENRQPTIFGDGLQSRDFTFVQDIVEANITAMKAKKENVCCESFNIARGEATTVLDLFGKIRSLLGKQNIEPKFLPARPGEARRTLANPEKAKRLMGFECSIPFEEGLEQTVEWYEENGKEFAK